MVREFLITVLSTRSTNSGRWGTDQILKVGIENIHTRDRDVGDFCGSDFQYITGVKVKDGRLPPPFKLILCHQHKADFGIFMDGEDEGVYVCTTDFDDAECLGCYCDHEQCYDLYTIGAYAIDKVIIAGDDCPPDDPMWFRVEAEV